MTAKVKSLTPRERLVEKFGSKEELAKLLAKKLDRPEGVTEADFTRHLKRQKNSRLLRLHAIVEAVEKEFGSKEALVKKILENLHHAKDKSYQEKLMSFNLAKLYDMRRKHSA